jgi:hypothetical protein
MFGGWAAVFDFRLDVRGSRRRATERLEVGVGRLWCVLTKFLPIASELDVMDSGAGRSAMTARRSR